MPLVIVGMVVTFLFVAVQEELAIVEVRKEVSYDMFTCKIQTGAEVDMLHRFEIIVVLPRLVNGVPFSLARWILTKDVAQCETRMRRSHNVDQHTISIGTVQEEVLRRMVIGNGTKQVDQV